MDSYNFGFFNDNEFYSEFDFPDEEVYHNGTGQLGQPSMIFETAIDFKTTFHPI